MMADDRPNIVLILAQGLRGDCTGFGGNPDVRTPNLDVIAQHGAVFRAASLDEPRDDSLLPVLLRDAGYQTIGVGEIANPADYDHTATIAEDYIAWLAKEGKTDRAAAWAAPGADDVPNTFTLAQGAQRSNLNETQYVSTWVGDQAVRCMRAPKTPFYLEVRFNKPAYPFDPPAAWDELYDRNVLTIPADLADVPQRALGMSLPRLRKVLAFYYAGISLIDQQVGRILATLNARARTNNLFVFSSDAVASIAGVETRHIPLLLAGLPDQVRGTIDDDPVTRSEVAATLLDAAGIETSDGLKARLGTT